MHDIDRCFLCTTKLLFLFVLIFLRCSKRSGENVNSLSGIQVRILVGSQVNLKPEKCCEYFYSSF